MDYQNVAIGALVAVTIISVAIAGLALGGVLDSPTSGEQASDEHDHSSHDHGASDGDNGTETEQTVSEDEVPEDVRSSVDGAQALKLNLTESEKREFRGANVSIKPTGEVTVLYASQADSGPALKEEMGELAIRYAHVVAEHNETGGLEVRANGVKLLVSSDAAEAYGNDRLKTDAYKETFHWGSYGKEESE